MHKVQSEKVQVYLELLDEIPRGSKLQMVKRLAGIPLRYEQLRLGDLKEICLKNGITPAAGGRPSIVGNCKQKKFILDNRRTIRGLISFMILFFSDSIWHSYLLFCS